jgi:hypothetical protein
MSGFGNFYGRYSSGFDTLSQRVPWTKAKWFFLINIVLLLLFSIYYTVRMWNTSTRDVHFNDQNPYDSKVEEGDDPAEFGIGDKIINGLYHGAVTQTSVGFGDYSPKSDEAKGMTMAHVMLVFVANLFLGLS